MESVFSEIFSFRVPGGEVFMQRRFELSPDWAGGLKSLPIVSDHSTSGTLFVLPADAVLLFRAGALTLPAGGTYSVQFHGSGKYFDTPAEALAYMTKRWPVPFSLWRQKLEQGENVLQQSHRRAAAFAEGSRSGSVQRGAGLSDRCLIVPGSAAIFRKRGEFY